MANGKCEGRWQIEDEEEEAEAEEEAEIEVREQGKAETN